MLTEEFEIQTPPSAPHYERSVLGTMLLDRHTAPVVLGRLETDDFYDQHHRIIYTAMQQLADRSEDIDLLSVEHQLRENGTYDQTGSYLGELTRAATGDLESKIDVIKDKATRRNLDHSLKLVHPMIFDNAVETGKITAKIEESQHHALQQSAIPGLTPQQIYERDQDRPKFERLKIGVPFFDHTFYATAGSHKGSTEVVIGHTKHGKTRYAKLRAALYAQQGYKGLYFTAEDTDSSVQQDIWRLLDDPEDAENIIIVDKSQGVTDLDKLINAIRYWDAKIGLDFVVVDYLQRIPVRDVPYGEEGTRIIHCSNRLTDLAVELALFVMNLAQPHRLEKTRRGWNAEPEVHDIYGSSAIEKDAYMVTSVFRPVLIKELRNTDHTGSTSTIQGPDGNNADKNSVYIRQKINRNDELYTQHFQFIDTDNGLRIASEVMAERRAQNGPQNSRPPVHSMPEDQPF